MEPIPELRGQLDRLSHLLGDDMDLAAYLAAVAQVAQALVPSCVGVSITIVIDGEPYTMTATTPETAKLDAVQNLEGGPCLDAISRNREIAVRDVLDEDRWQLFARAAAAHNVRSTLSFPIRDVEDLVAGGVNMYASDPDAFAGDRRAVAVALGAELSEVVLNADLSFRTLADARELPERLDAKERVETAVGVLSVRRQWSPEQARRQLVKVAEQAGLSPDAVADVLVALVADDHTST